MKKYKTPFYILLHPIEGFEILFYKKWGSAAVATCIAFISFITLIAQRQLSGFIFNSGVNPETLNIPVLFVQSVVMYFMFCAINWALCTLFDGKGRLREIWIALNYALLPFIFTNIINIVLSNVLRLDEGMFMEIITWVGYLFTAFYVIKAFEAVHQYSLSQALTSIIATFVGMGIVFVLILLLLSLSQQMLGFITTAVKELMLRNY